MHLLQGLKGRIESEGKLVKDFILQQWVFFYKIASQPLVIFNKVSLVDEINQVRKWIDSSTSCHQYDFSYWKVIKLKPKSLLLADIQVLSLLSDELMCKLAIRVVLEQDWNGLFVTNSFITILLQRTTCPQMRLQEEDVFPIQKIGTGIKSGKFFILGEAVESSQLLDIRISKELQRSVGPQMKLIDVSSRGDQPQLFDCYSVYPLQSLIAAWDIQSGNGIIEQLNSIGGMGMILDACQLIGRVDPEQVFLDLSIFDALQQLKPCRMPFHYTGDVINIISKYDQAILTVNQGFQVSHWSQRTTFLFFYFRIGKLRSKKFSFQIYGEQNYFQYNQDYNFTVLIHFDQFVISLNFCDDQECDSCDHMDALEVQDGLRFTSKHVCHPGQDTQDNLPQHKAQAYTPEKRMKIGWKVFLRIEVRKGV